MQAQRNLVSGLKSHSKSTVKLGFKPGALTQARLPRMERIDSSPLPSKEALYQGAAPCVSSVTSGLLPVDLLCWLGGLAPFPLLYQHPLASIQ